ncbi:hypothetical protein [Caulobacter phage KcrB]|nr:hypothetical protein RW_GP023 [Caulobacter phage RW]WCA46327.1 hypothetical protein [Caulobacter phage KcrB]WCD56262.1 hypothetical protein [Caulobacter phage RLK]WNV48054.1 hypothetical protein GB2A_gp022 [Caulobacter phage GB2A]
MTYAPTILGRFRSINADVRVSLTTIGQIGVALPDFEIKSGSTLSGCTAFGDEFEDALAALWQKIADLPPDQYLVRDAMGADRKGYRWDGYSWVSAGETST